MFSKVKTQAGQHQVLYDYDASTSALRKRYPTLGTVETLPAWRRKDEVRPKPTT